MEYVDVLDSSGRPIGKMKPKSEVHRDGDWHGAAHLWILNREGQILIDILGTTLNTPFDVVKRWGFLKMIIGPRLTVGTVACKTR